VIRIGSFVLSLTFVSLVAGPMLSDAASLPALLPACSGCSSTDNGTWNNSGGCIVITNNSFSIQNGTCPANCSASGCPLSGGYTITNNCPGTIYTKKKWNTTCDTSETQIAGGGGTLNVNYSGTLNCGVQEFYLISLSSFGSSCPSNTTAGWSFVCTACAEPPH
jgi:hypothetical protein